MKAKISPHQGNIPIEDSQFLQEMRTLESLLEFDCTLDIITNLLQLYTAAIESYESQRDPAYKIYKSKMQSLLRSPKVILLLNPEPPKPLQLPEPFQLRPRALSSTPTHKRLEISTERIAEKALQWHNNESSFTKEKLQENLKSQIEMLNLRIHSRRKESLQKENFMKFEKGVEEIMEEYVREKNKAKAEIYEKYREELEDLQKMEKSELILSVIRETEKKIQEELNERVQEVEAKKRRRIQGLKGAVRLHM